ncbi:hypothetical protein M3Y99_01551400 [Aphelenchoides fujianensis]|nr:hypothetical protein M3Y99_01551400 [Aphelenchoides fujianensis]
MSTLQKHKDFVSEPIKDKPISAIAGIGPTYETKLESMKFTKAYHLLGSFLLHDKDEEKFCRQFGSVPTDWLVGSFQRGIWTVHCAHKTHGDGQPLNVRPERLLWRSWFSLP